MALAQTPVDEHDPVNLLLPVPVLNGEVINTGKFGEVKLRSICPLSLESTPLLEQQCEAVKKEI